MLGQLGSYATWPEYFIFQLGDEITRPGYEVTQLKDFVYAFGCMLEHLQKIYLLPLNRNFMVKFQTYEVSSERVAFH